MCIYVYMYMSMYVYMYITTTYICRKVVCIKLCASETQALLLVRSIAQHIAQHP